MRATVNAIFRGSRCRLVPDVMVLGFRGHPKCQQLRYTSSQFDSDEEQDLQNTDASMWLGTRETPRDLQWLEQGGDRVKAFIHKERMNAMKSLADTREFCRSFMDQIQAVCPSPATSFPEARGSYEYFQRYPQGLELPVYCRRPVTFLGGCESPVESKEEVLVDLPLLHSATGFVRLRDLRISPCEKYVGYTVDTSRRERYHLHILDIAEAQKDKGHVDRPVQDVGGFEWAADGALLYTSLNARRRPCMVRRHVLGTDSATHDNTVWEEPAEDRSLMLGSTKDGKFLTITTLASRTAQVALVPSSASQSPPQHLTKWEPGIEYTVEHAHGWLYLLISTAPYGCKHLLRTRQSESDATTRDSWQVVVSERSNVVLEGMDMFSSACVLYERRHGSPAVSVVHLPDEGKHFVSDSPQLKQQRGGTEEMPKCNVVPRLVEYESLLECSAIIPRGNALFDASACEIEVSSPVKAPRVYSINLATCEPTLCYKQQLRGYLTDFEDHHVCRRLYATAPDGTQVPITVAHRKGLELNGTNPSVIYVYGAYGIPLETGFDISQAALLSRGFVLAWAHVRGGGELGTSWHEKACNGNKRVSVDDFIACADTLVAERYTASNQMAASAESAGGVVLAAAISKRPDLVCLMLLHSPFLDVLTSMERRDLSLTVEEYEEWGDPNEPRQLLAMHNYCPLRCIERNKAELPAFLIQGYMEDERVPPWGMMKWAVLARRGAQHAYDSDDECYTTPRPMLLWMSKNDHFGSWADKIVQTGLLVKTLRSAR